MKKLFGILLLFSAMALFVTSCSSSSSPGDAFKGYMELMKKGDAKAFAQAFAVDETQTPEEQEQAAQLIEGLIGDKTKKMMEEKQGLKDVQVLEENISEDGKTATLKVKFVYGDGTEEESTQEMVKQDGKWKMVFKK